MARERLPERPLGHQFAMTWLEEGPAGAARLAASTGQQKLLDSFLRVQEEEEVELAFLHSALCSMSLPIDEPADPTASIIRNDGRYALAISPKPVLQIVNGQPEMRSLGVPYGSYPRVALIWILSQAVRYNTRDVYLGKNFTEWCRKLGYTNLSYGPRGTATRIKEQVDRLLACEWQIRWDGDQDGDAAFAVKEVKLSNEYSGSMKAGEFTREIRLSEIFYSHLKDHAVPLNEVAISQLKGQSVALDLYCYLAYRLPRVRGASQLITWEQLYKHLGSNCQPKVFKQTVRKALNVVTAVYPNANVDMSNPGVVKLYPSPAPDERRLVGPHLRLVGRSSSPKGSTPGHAESVLPASQEGKSSVEPKLKRVGEGREKRTPLLAIRGFPTGSLRYGGEREKRFYAVGIAKGGGYDVENLAEAYRRRYGETMKNRSEEDVMRSWEGFCKAYADVRGGSAY